MKEENLVDKMDSYESTIFRIDKFETHVDDMYMRLEDYLGKTPELIDRSETLSSYGFLDQKNPSYRSAKKLFENLEIERNYFVSYQTDYPQYKFISDRQLKELLVEFNLVIGETWDYLSDVPKSKLFELKQVKVNDEDYKTNRDSLDFINDVSVDKMMTEIFVALKSNDISALNFSKIIKLVTPLISGFTGLLNKSKNRAKIAKFTSSLKIVAAPHVMNKKSVYKNRIIDPFNPTVLVLHPVKGGWLKITDWKCEALNYFQIN